jgi:2-methylcitrate dehydratase PrpD
LFTLAGLDEPVARILRDEIAENSRGRSSIVGSTLTCAPADAALVNGATSHALDYDDVHPLVGENMDQSSKMHPAVTSGERLDAAPTPNERYNAFRALEEKAG